MAATTTSPLLPQQPQPEGAVTNIPEAVPTNGNELHSSGSIGPFFAVISVLTILAILSCFIGRKLTREGHDTLKPLEGIGHGGYLGWFRRRFGQCVAGDVEVGARVAALGVEKNEGKAGGRGNEVQQPQGN